jgi:hypothetical protein
MPSFKVMPIIIQIVPYVLNDLKWLLPDLNRNIVSERLGI